MFSTFTYKYLSFRRPTRPPHPLPAGIDRHFIKTPGGDIEVLYAAPTSPSRGDDVTPLFFVHGGMGGAWVWAEYMQYFSARGIPCYAVSMRGHGDSWYPSFLRMCYFTTKRMLADDVVAGVRWAQAREGGNEVVLVGHSSGGGLSQFILSQQELKVKGLVLAGAVPGFGSLGVYMNWFRADPWFSFRMIFHGWHPNSPLSHPALTRRIFFSNELSDAYVNAFQSRSSPYESFLWPLGMSYPFADPQRVLGQISSWGRAPQGLMVLYGGIDVIMNKTQMEKLGQFYRTAFSALVGKEKLGAEDRGVTSLAGEVGETSVGHGVRVGVVPGAGHHLQNDVTWEIGAKKLLEFYDQL